MYNLYNYARILIIVVLRILPKYNANCRNLRCMGHCNSTVAYNKHIFLKTFYLSLANFGFTT